MLQPRARGERQLRRARQRDALDQRAAVGRPVQRRRDEQAQLVDEARGEERGVDAAAAFEREAGHAEAFVQRFERRRQVDVRTRRDNVGDAIGGQPWISPWTATAGAEYDFQLMENDAYARVDYEFASHNGWPLATQNPLSESYDPNLVADPATNFVSARAGAIIGPLDASLFMNNVLNAHPRLDLNHQDTSTLLYEASTFRPRTTGLTLTYRF